MRLITTILQENQLIEKLQAADEVAFRYLVEHFQNKIYNTVLAIVQDANDAEDLTQEVFVEVYESIGGFRAEAKLYTWLYRIATQKALESHRRRKTRKRFAFLTSLFGDNDEPKHHPPDFVHPGIQLENKERASILFNTINKLPDNQKVAFTLHHVEGLSYQEITEVMQTSLSAVESLIHRAKHNLRKLLGRYYSQNEE